MKKTLVIVLLFFVMFLSACLPQTKKTAITSTQIDTIQADSGDTQFGASCSLASTGASDCDTNTGKLFSITSPVFKNGDKIPNKYSCLGKDINPPFEIINIPQGTQSLALIAHDPDAPNGDWIHWIIWNFSAKFTQIEEGKTPGGATIGENSRGEASYRGPCPPSGTHRYIFKLYALDTNYGDLSSKMTLAGFEGIVQGHVLGTAQIMGTYSK